MHAVICIDRARIERGFHLPVIPFARLDDGIAFMSLELMRARLRDRCMERSVPHRAQQFFLPLGARRGRLLSDGTTVLAEDYQSPTKASVVTIGVTVAVIDDKVLALLQPATTTEFSKIQQALETSLSLSPPHFPP